MSGPDEKKAPKRDAIPEEAGPRDGAPTEAELFEAEVAARELEEGLDAFSEMLVSSYRPHEIEDDVHERILARALGSDAGSGSRAPAAPLAPEAPATEPERRDAERLRRALEVKDEGPDAEVHPLAAVARALKHAHDPAGISELRNEALLRPALKRGSSAKRTGYVAVTIVSAVAIAAGFFGLFMRSPAPKEDPSAMNAPAPRMEIMPGMFESRSTTELFSEPDFPREGGVRERIDRISATRNAELRENRFVEWGVP